MKVNEKNLKWIETLKGKYLKGEILEKFFKDLEIKYAAGHWAAGPFADRFAPAGYSDESGDIIEQIKRVGKAGIQGIEFHEAVFIDKNYKKDPSKISRVKEALKKNNLIPTNMNTNLFSDKKWKLGGVTNPDKEVRKEALEVALQGVDIAKEVGCTSVALWPGSDGWDYNFEANYGELLDLFIEACVAINKKCIAKGLRFGIEAKPKEPRMNMVIQTTAKAAALAKLINEKCGGNNMGVAVDYGHEHMYGNEAADAIYTTKRIGVDVVNFHINNARFNGEDDDMIAGTGNLWKFVDFILASIETGYQGWVGEDQFTYRVDAVKSMALSREFFGNSAKKALLIYIRRDKLKRAQRSGDMPKVLELTGEIIYNG